MKISLNWLLDHLQCNSLKDLDVNLEHLMAKFNQKVAEIEGFSLENFDKERFFAAKVIACTPEHCTLSIPEKKLELSLPLRSEAKVNDLFLLYADKKELMWCTLNHLGLKKDGLAPAVQIEEKALTGAWKQSVEWNDAILEVDNKTITHRPDMWGHRGFAREISMLTGQALRSTESLITKLPTVANSKLNLPLELKNNVLKLKNLAPTKCKAFSAAKFNQVSNLPSIPFMLFRLARVDIRPINAIIDLTNYLTADWGQPVHAYDSTLVPDDELVIRLAAKNESLELLDDQSLILNAQDLVIANNQQALSLAGVMGGKQSAIKPTTNSIVFESANFIASSIRYSAQRHKLRTESSARFEKTLHPELALESVYRFYHLAKRFGLQLNLQGSVVSLCEEKEPTVINIHHEFLEQRIGVQLREQDVTKPLMALEFGVETDYSDEKPFYRVMVPNFRASKDIKIAEDLVEEVARCYGFDKIQPQLPKLQPKAHDIANRQKVLNAKNFLAHCAQMIEQCNYVFFNQDWLNRISFNPGKTLKVKNPVNENTVQLVTTLIPGLLANLEKNYHQADRLAFFEIGKIWLIKDDVEHDEIAMLSGIVWQKRQPMNFFAAKAMLEQLLNIFNVDSSLVTWHKTHNEAMPWEHPFTTATIEYRGQKLGKAGKINHLVWANLDYLPSCDGFFFELNLELLKSLTRPSIQAKPLPKTQEQFFDLAFIAHDNSLAESFTNTLMAIDKRVKTVILMDQFRKPEWTDKRSLTFRIKLQSNDDEPISKENLEQIAQQAKASLMALNTEIRS